MRRGLGSLLLTSALGQQRASLRSSANVKYWQLPSAGGSTPRVRRQSGPVVPFGAPNGGSRP
jgi:hypothetical protein